MGLNSYPLQHGFGMPTATYSLLLFIVFLSPLAFGDTNLCKFTISKKDYINSMLVSAHNPNIGEKFKGGSFLRSNYPKDSVEANEDLNEFDKFMFKKSLEKGKELAIWQAYDKDGKLLLQSAGFEGERNSIGNYVSGELIYKHFIKLRDRIINEKIVGVRKLAFRHTHPVPNSAAFSNGDVEVGYNYREFLNNSPAGRQANLEISVLGLDFFNQLAKRAYILEGKN